MENKIGVKNNLVTWAVTPQKTQLEIINELAVKVHSDTPQVVRRGGMISTPLVEGKWRYEPLLDISIIPVDARDRLELFLEHITPMGVIIGHELKMEVETKPKVEPKPWVVAPEEEPLPWIFTPKIKPSPWIVAPEVDPIRFPQPTVNPLRKAEPFRLPQPTVNPLREIDWRQVGRVTWKVTKVVGGVALGTLAILGMALGTAVGCALDPAIIVCTDDEEWVEIYRYYPEEET